MQLPTALLQSLHGLPGFNREAFEAVHASGEQLTSLRIHSSKISDVNALQDFNQPCSFRPVPWCGNGYYISPRPSFTLDPLFHAGAYYVQEASSMFLEQAMHQSVDLLQPLLVVDLCAAPGGKSTLLQSILSKQSLLISNEVIQSRVTILRENIIKWGAENVVITNNDPRDFKQLSGLVDVLVVDAPCSGSGLFRRDPEAIREWSPANVELCSQRQQRILADAWDCLKEDGVLIYSTCSYSAEEDEEIAEWMLQHKEAESVRLRTEDAWGMEEVQSQSGAYGYRCWPDKVKGEGFFIAIFRKKEAIHEQSLRIKKKIVPTQADIHAAASWLKNQDEKSFVLQGSNIAVVPAAWHELVQFLMQHLKVRYAGVELGTIAKNDLLPEHALAVSQLVSDTIPFLEVSHEQALQYLRRQEMNIQTTIKGWALVRYKGLNLGWVKCLGNRINNYYPKEYRILKS